MVSIKKSIMFALSVAITLLIVRKGYKILFDSGVVLPETLTGQSESENGSINLRYNYTRMLAIVDQCQKVRSAFKEQFGPDGAKVRIDRDLTKELLADVYRERVRLHRYTYEMKVRYKGSVPEKKARTIIYYQKIIDTNARALEIIIRQL